jgi:hypothetical protein
MANKHRKVWKVVFRKPVSGKQTKPKFFTTFGKCFPPKIKGKHFPGNQAKFFFDWKVFSVDRKIFSVNQLF